MGEFFLYLLILVGGFYWGWLARGNNDAAMRDRAKVPVCGKCGEPTILKGGMGADVEMCPYCDRL